MVERGPSLDRGTKGGKTFALRMIEWADPDSLEGAQETRRRNRLEGALTATVRTLANDEQLTVRFRGREARWGVDGCTLPRLPAKPDWRDWLVARGRADSLALYLRYRNDRAETNWQPREPGARAGFDLLMRCRADALGALRFPGIDGNLDAALGAELAHLGVDADTQPNLLPAEGAITATLRDAFGARVRCLQPLQIDAWRRWLDGLVPGALDALAASLSDVDVFARTAATLAPALAGMMSNGMSPQAAPQPADSPDADTASKQAPNPAVETAEPDQAALAPDAGSTQPAPTSAAGAPYRIFTDKYDRVVYATDLALPDQLGQLYASLRADMDVQRGVITRLANRLQRVILAQQRRHWDFDQDEGLLDTAKLDRVVVNPSTALSFKVDRDGSFRDTAVTLLVDNSGSMRGASIRMAAMSADIIADALERCGVAVEVLGFTTTDWRGGRPAVDWARQGRAEFPGRLNALQHIIYKRADQPWRRQHTNIAAMLLPSLLRENIDGEALLWAWSRLAMRPEARKILMVISDGAPNDAATIAANDPAILDRHLREVIDGLQHQSALELCAIGIGHDVDRYYDRAVTLKDADALGPAMIGQLADLFGDPAGR
jgi:cobaltochelatase CobT